MSGSIDLIPTQGRAVVHLAIVNAKKSSSDLINLRSESCIAVVKSVIAVGLCRINPNRVTVDLKAQRNGQGSRPGTGSVADGETDEIGMRQEVIAEVAHCQNRGVVGGRSKVNSRLEDIAIASRIEQ